MANQKQNKERRSPSVARRRAEAQKHGFDSTTLNLPEGLRLFDWKEGVMEISIIPYIAGKGNKFASPGEEYFERTYWVYRNIGVEDNWYCAPSKTFGKKDPIKEWVAKEAAKPDADEAFLKKLRPSERCLMLVFDHNEPDKGLQLMDKASFHFFELLLARIEKSDERMGWDRFWYPDEEGKMLRVETAEEKPYGIKATAIDFMQRDSPLPDEIINHDICLDDMPIEFEYDKLRAIFLQIDDGDDGEDAQPAKPKPKAKKKEEVVDEDDAAPFEEEEEKPAPKAKAKPKKEEPASKKSKPKEKTAEDVGLSKGDTVTYDGKSCTIVKISPDGTSLTLMDEDDDLIKAIGVDEVSLEEEEAEVETKPAKSKSKPTKEKKEDPAEEEDDDDGDWDFPD